MTTTRRPRVAAIGLDGLQAASIKPLCGELREANTLEEYLERYSWIETDVMVSSRPMVGVQSGVSLMTVGPNSFLWTDIFENPLGSRTRHSMSAKTDNTERELTVPSGCPALYKPLADELSKQLASAPEPPAVFATSRQAKTALITTTSGYPVALRLVLPALPKEANAKSSKAIALILPGASNLVAWFRALLCELHEVDPSRVPQEPPRLSQPSDWYTPEERVLATRKSNVESEVQRLNNELNELQAELADEGQRANNGIRRALWADGDELVGAVGEIFSDLGFKVRDMDAELVRGEPKREDLRLTLPSMANWQAIVEVKGYPSGTKTNDARQIREHRDRYVIEEDRNPELTVWLSNTYRATDPSFRPALDKNVEEQAANVGAVHVLVTDLYRQWALVAEGSIDAGTVVKSLVNANPGLWTPPVSGLGPKLNPP